MLYPRPFFVELGNDWRASTDAAKARVQAERRVRVTKAAETVFISIDTQANSSGEVSGRLKSFVN